MALVDITYWCAKKYIYFDLTNKVKYYLSKWESKGKLHLQHWVLNLFYLWRCKVQINTPTPTQTDKVNLDVFKLYIILHYASPITRELPCFTKKKWNKSHVKYRYSILTFFIIPIILIEFWWRMWKMQFHVQYIG